MALPLWTSSQVFIYVSLHFFSIIFILVVMIQIEAKEMRTKVTQVTSGLATLFLVLNSPLKLCPVFPPLYLYRHNDPGKQGRYRDLD